jgi:hypothetical protein
MPIKSEQAVRILRYQGDDWNQDDRLLREAMEFGVTAIIELDQLRAEVERLRGDIGAAKKREESLQCAIGVHSRNLLEHSEALTAVNARVEVAEKNLADCRSGSAELARWVENERLLRFAAERERDDLREESAYIQQQLEWIEENGDTYTKESLLDFIRRTIHAIDHTAVIKEALATRDAQQRREGAIEALEDIAKDSGIDGGKAYIATVIYREFPDVLTTRVGVVEGADLLQAAQRLREGGE